PRSARHAGKRSDGRLWPRCRSGRVLSPALNLADAPSRLAFSGVTDVGMSRTLRVARGSSPTTPLPVADRTAQEPTIAFAATIGTLAGTFGGVPGANGVIGGDRSDRPSVRDHVGSDHRHFGTDIWWLGSANRDIGSDVWRRGRCQLCCWHWSDRAA